MNKDEAYNLIDRFLRNNLDDDDYAEFSEALDSLSNQDKSIEWVPGSNEFKNWCSVWFGPDADDDYLAQAVFDLPPMAQNFKYTGENY